MKTKRKKLVHAREPNGRVSRSGESRYCPAEIRRMRQAAFRGLKDAEWGTELGRLNLEGKISDEMYGAGKWWAELVEDYHRAMSAPSPPPKALSLERSGPQEPPDPESETGQVISRKERAAIAKFEGAHRELKLAGSLAEKVTREICEHDRSPCGTYELLSLCNGLSWLSRHKGLTGRNKSDVR